MLRHNCPKADYKRYQNQCFSVNDDKKDDENDENI